jgi:hypothetical protein
MAKITEIEKLFKTSRSYYIEIFSFSNETSSRRKTIKFPAFLTDFTDSYVSDWKEEAVYGKMDPIATFKSTKRNINMSFDVPSDSIEVAKENLRQIDFLIRGLYPIYDNGTMGTAVLASPPMFRVRFSNLVRNVAQTNDDSFLRTGLLSYIKSFDFKPKVDSGFFVDGIHLFPKLIVVNLSLQIIHEHALGKYTNGDEVLSRDNFDRFPHEIGSARSKIYKATKSSASNRQTSSKIEEAEAQAADELCIGED